MRSFTRIDYIKTKSKSQFSSFNKKIWYMYKKIVIGALMSSAVIIFIIYQLKTENISLELIISYVLQLFLKELMSEILIKRFR